MPTKSSGDTIAENDDAVSIIQSKHGSNYKNQLSASSLPHCFSNPKDPDFRLTDQLPPNLSTLAGSKAQKRPTHSRQCQRAYESPRHGAGECKMVIVLSQPQARMLPFRGPWYTISQDVMSSLDIERLLDFGIRREKEVDEDDGWYEEGDEGIYSLDLVCNCIHG